jgi:dihydroorotase
VRALVDGIRDGTITAIATDHAPHSPGRKATTLDAAPFGVIGLETSFAVSHAALVESGAISLETLVGLYVDGPAAIVGMDAPAIAVGRRAGINVVDPGAPWVVEPAKLRSRSRNCPFKARRLSCRVIAVVAGRNVLRT